MEGVDHTINITFNKDLVPGTPFTAKVHTDEQSIYKEEGRKVGEEGGEKVAAGQNRLSQGKEKVPESTPSNLEGKRLSK